MSEDQKLDFWKYYDLKGNQILDNRHVLANLIACAPDTPRAVDQQVVKLVFDLQENVIADIVRSHEELAALQVAPQAIDPLQQTVATVIQNQLNHPDVDRKRAIGAIEFLIGPMLPVQLKELRKLYKGSQRDASITNLTAGIEGMQSAFGSTPDAEPTATDARAIKLQRGDLRLICFDVLSDS